MIRLQTIPSYPWARSNRADWYGSSDRLTRDGHLGHNSRFVVPAKPKQVVKLSENNLVLKAQSLTKGAQGAKLASEQHVFPVNKNYTD
ncbi:hypothetical protein K443DRAFT_674063 [Laccaria amethystina LaAM-08-1]|uniref:Uncharacterized protein n=1 Tax=Laccaria amethystina LaAM-08-1 TaxID=1095629 RepID=A0A0C9XYK5_9AGAR|nr:hypothetical protein K443DRAFT_674063 [Laccaria amethystina LaAM-08-1]